MQKFSSISNPHNQQKSSASFFYHKNNSSFFSSVIQPKVTISSPNDIYEQEADATADKVIRMHDKANNKNAFFKPASNIIQRKCEHCEKEEKKKVQMKGEGNAVGGMNAPPIVNDVINSSGQPLDTGTRNFMESRFGYDFGNVQVHDDLLAHQSSKEINAKAYTNGNHIVFGSGQYQPGNDSGKQLLAHELTHVVQQNSGNDKSSSIQRDLFCYNTLQTDYKNLGGGMGVSVGDIKSAEAGGIRSALDSLIKVGKIKEITSKDKAKSWFAPDNNVQKSEIEALLKAAGYSKYSELADAILDIHGEYLFTGESSYTVGTTLTPPKTDAPSIKRRETRSLTESEIHEAKLVFGSALKYHDVTIDENSSFYTFPRHKYVRTIQETIHFPGVVDSMPLLIHELTHVWQYQRGAHLLDLALSAIDGTYDYGTEDDLKKYWSEGKAFSEFTTEQQGDILQHYYTKLIAKGDTSAFDGFIGRVKTGDEDVGWYPTVEPIDYGKIDWVKDNEDFRAKTEAEIISKLKISMKPDDERAPARAKEVVALFKSLGSYWYGTYNQRFIDHKSSDELVNLVIHNLSYESKVRIYKAIYLEKKFWK